MKRQSCFILLVIVIIVFAMNPIKLSAADDTTDDSWTTDGSGNTTTTGNVEISNGGLEMNNGTWTGASGEAEIRAVFTYSDTNFGANGSSWGFETFNDSQLNNTYAGYLFGARNLSGSTAHMGGIGMQYIDLTAGSEDTKFGIFQRINGVWRKTIEIDETGNLGLNLGNIQLNSKYISNDGDNEGIQIEDDGDVKITNKIGIGIFPTSLLTLNKSGTGAQTSEITIKSNNTDVARYGWNASGYLDIRALYSNNNILLTPSGTGYIQCNGNIRTNSNFISGDGGNEGIQIDYDGNVMVSDKLGINTSPLYPIHSRMGSSGAMPANSASDDLVLETNNNTGISLLCPNTGKGCILFGSNTSVTRGRIYYDHQIDEMSFFTREHKCLSINFDGKVCIGPSSPENDSKLTVAGKISAQDITIKADAGGADFVFEKDYNLPSLDHVEKFVKANKHLPEIPSVKEMQENGIQVSEMQILHLQKIEELTLYIIEQNKKIKALESRLSKLERH